MNLLLHWRYWVIFINIFPHIEALQFMLLRLCFEVGTWARFIRESDTLTVIWQHNENLAYLSFIHPQDMHILQNRCLQHHFRLSRQIVLCNQHDLAGWPTRYLYTYHLVLECKGSVHLSMQTAYHHVRWGTLSTLHGASLGFRRRKQPTPVQDSCEYTG
jgi:hypothetical protein